MAGRWGCTSGSSGRRRRTASGWRWSREGGKLEYGELDERRRSWRRGSGSWGWVGTCWWGCAGAVAGDGGGDAGGVEGGRWVRAAGPGLPAERLTFMVEDARLAVLLTQRALRERDAAATRGECWRWTRSGRPIAECAAEKPMTAVEGTSGVRDLHVGVDGRGRRGR